MLLTLRQLKQQLQLLTVGLGLSSLIMMILLIVTVLCLSSCTLGTKQQVDIVYASVTPPISGGIRIATNKPIPVTIGGNYSEQDFGGFYIVSESDLRAFLKAVQYVSDTKTTGNRINNSGPPSE